MVRKGISGAKEYRFREFTVDMVPLINAIGIEMLSMNNGVYDVYTKLQKNNFPASLFDNRQENNTNGI